MNILAVFNVIMAIIGMYVVISAVVMKNKGTVSSIIVPEEVMKECKDKEGFIRFFYPKQLLFGICSILLGTIGAIDGWVISLGYFKYIEMLIFLAVFVWLEEMIKKARKMFFQES